MVVILDLDSSSFGGVLHLPLYSIIPSGRVDVS